MKDSISNFFGQLVEVGQELLSKIKVSLAEKNDLPGWGQVTPIEGQEYAKQIRENEYKQPAPSEETIAAILDECRKYPWQLTVSSHDGVVTGYQLATVAPTVAKLVATEKSYPLSLFSSDDYECVMHNMCYDSLNLDHTFQEINIYKRNTEKSIVEDLKEIDSILNLPIAKDSITNSIAVINNQLKQFTEALQFVEEKKKIYRIKEIDCLMRKKGYIKRSSNESASYSPYHFGKSYSTSDTPSQWVSDNKNALRFGMGRKEYKILDTWNLHGKFAFNIELINKDGHLVTIASKWNCDDAEWQALLTNLDFRANL